MTPSVRLTKRLIDVVGATVGLSITLPLLPLVAAAIGLESMGGKVLLRRTRAGRMVVGRGKPGLSKFDMFRLNTGVSEPEPRHPANSVSPPSPGMGKVACFFRNTRLDELPQLLNVLRGEMSLVGPKPERPELTNVLLRRFPFYDQILSDLKPGMTGLERIAFRYPERIPTDASLEPYHDLMTGQSALAEDLRLKYALDMRYSAASDDFAQYLRLEFRILLHSPLALLGKIFS